MSEITIPPAALEAGAKALCAKAGYAWTETPDVHAHWREQARAAFRAMLEAWPGAYEEYMNYEDGDGASVCVILPKENPDAEA